MNKAIYIKRVQRIRRKLKKNNTNRFRLSIYKSSRNISAQIVDDKNNKTLVSASSLSKKITDKKKSDVFIYIAGLLAKKALEKKITKVFFDRGRFKYHGNIKLFAETLRKNGLNF
ncbi:MAG: 50S ribosomal protein L18 [Candidatus Pelagibacter sp.]|jgi:large subunit ribosomal protein L18|nr:50S ribosomal protein L18 [Candidatus Pelagibacter sp.]|tara:strand:+ start:938 stop:1282 length:345 start_codon:yes stop_codon:yes gene_type:complete